jgi:hypothetical protein
VEEEMIDGKIGYLDAVRLRYYCLHLYCVYQRFAKCDLLYTGVVKAIYVVPD